MLKLIRKSLDMVFNSDIIVSESEKTTNNKGEKNV